MTRSRRILATAATVGLSLGAAGVTRLDGAEPEERSLFTCDVRADVLVPSGSRLVVHHPSAEQQWRIAAARPQSFGPFDRSVYGFERVLFYLDVPEPGASSRVQEADLLIRLEGPRAPWFRMVGSELRPEVPQLVVRPQSEGQGGPVGAATPDPALPLFVVEATTDDARSDVAVQYLIDLRPGRPRVPALLDCVEVASRDAGGAWDADCRSGHGSTACAWDAERGDFRCRETRATVTPWGRRVAVREYPLLSLPEPKAAREARIASELAESVATVAADPSARREVDTIGPVHLVATLPRGGGGSLVLLGAAGTSAAFGARFFLGVRAADGSVRVTSVIESDLSAPSGVRDGLGGQPVEAPGTPQPGELSFRAIPLVSDPAGSSILRVRVREGTPSQGEGPQSAEAVYWVGIEDRGAKVIAGALRLATSTAEYTGCESARTAPNAVGVRVLSKVPFAAELEVEPPHVTDSFSEGLRVIDEARPEGTGSVERESPACPVRLRVTWRSGFATRAVDAPTACPGAEARLAQIDDDGEIRAVPAPRAQRARPEP